MITIDWLFYLMALLTLMSSGGVVLLRNPIYCSLSLAITMILFAALFYRLDAQFIAGVQLIVYAGAVMVLFVMVLMLFDLKHEDRAFSKGAISTLLKVASAGALCGFIVVAANFSTDYVLAVAKKGTTPWNANDATKDIAMALFSKYVFGFEMIGVLLLVIAIGAVALSRIVGGTHAKH
jgi:NADH-quinone oxidoreductase subunit J